MLSRKCHILKYFLGNRNTEADGEVGLSTAVIAIISIVSAIAFCGYCCGYYYLCKDRETSNEEVPSAYGDEGGLSPAIIAIISIFFGGCFCVCCYYLCKDDETVKTSNVNVP